MITLNIEFLLLSNAHDDLRTRKMKANCSLALACPTQPVSYLCSVGRAAVKFECNEWWGYCYENEFEGGEERLTQ